MLNQKEPIDMDMIGLFIWDFAQKRQRKLLKNCKSNQQLSPNDAYI